MDRRVVLKRAVVGAVVATGLDSPRGLSFGPDGALYVAEAGVGGTGTSVAACPQHQVGPP
jgi:glucose/arabinose dehydrogenase